MAANLALRVNQRAVTDAAHANSLAPLRVTIREIMLAALLHDLGKQHEDCAPFIELLRGTDLRGDANADATQRADYLLNIVRDVHCRKGPCMIDRLREVSFARSSTSLMTSVSPARLLRDQSITATRVLSPGARDVLCSNWPSVTPWAYQDWLKVSSAPKAILLKPESAAASWLERGASWFG